MDMTWSPSWMIVYFQLKEGKKYTLQNHTPYEPSNVRVGKDL